MTLAAKRRLHLRTVLLDLSLEEFPLFRLSDTTDDSAISYPTDDGGPVARETLPSQPFSRPSRG